MKRKRKNSDVHPKILERAVKSHKHAENEPKTFAARWFFGDRQSGEIRDVEMNAEISLETRIEMVEAASIIAEFEKLKADFEKLQGGNE